MDTLGTLHGRLEIIGCVMLQAVSTFDRLCPRSALARRSKLSNDR
jgi:hypothetical protein